MSRPSIAVRTIPTSRSHPGRSTPQIGEEFPFDSLAILRSFCFGGMDSGEDQLRIMLLFPNRRTNHCAAKPQFEDCG